MRQNSSNLSRLSRPRGSRGTVLVSFVLMLFVLMAILALVVDLGFVALARRQMTTATDAAALEGLRWRDEPGVDDAERRSRARRLLQSTFQTPDVDPPTSAPRMGAGLFVEFDPDIGLPLGDSGFRASQHYGPQYRGDSLRTYLPDEFQTNGYDGGGAGNAPGGDLVSGTYLETGSHQEESDYSRGDFQPDTDPNAVAGEAFLVRMRRTGEGVDEPQGLSSGPRLPSLFGRGSLLAPELKGAGVAVRSTSIANAQPAAVVGPPIAPSAGFDGLPGATPFAISRTALGSTFVAGGGAVDVEVDAAGTLSVSGGGPVVGRITAWPSGRPAIGWRVDIPPVAQPTNQIPWTTGAESLSRYAPVYEALDDGTGGATVERVIGFIRVAVETTSPLRLRVLRGGVAGLNALAAPNGDDLSGSGVAALQALEVSLAAARSFREQLPEYVLLAPVLVRSE